MLYLSLEHDMDPGLRGDDVFFVKAVNKTWMAVRSSCKGRSNHRHGGLLRKRA